MTTNNNLSNDVISLNDAQTEKLHLITRDLQEVLGEHIIKSKLSKNEQLKCYWG